MSEVYRPAETRPFSAAWWKMEPAIGPLLIVALLFLTFLSIQQLTPPAALGVNAHLNEFSAGRAMTHLAHIARTAHPIGAPEHAEVRRYIVQELGTLGLNPEVQETTSVNPTWGTPFIAGTVHNVVATLKGTQNSQAMLLVGHYDSVPTGPGAADNGAAVATMLETLRALKNSEPLKNDVIVLFTDAEEFGSLGAYAFVDQHPWAKNVGWVVNIDARGNDGPVIMFETSPQNGGLIREFAQAAPYPVAMSFSYDIYRLLPNNTDFTIFKDAKLSGLNLANINGFISYHTQLDSIENIDQRTLQHQGSYTLGLLRHFGNLRLPIPPEGNAVYFNSIGSILIHYPASWSIVWTLLTGLLFVAVLIVGFRFGHLKTSGIIRGFLMLLATMLIAVIAGTVLSWLIRGVHTDERLANQSNTYNSYLFMIGFVLLAVALTSMVCKWFRRRTNVESLATGALLWWFIAMIVTTVLLPGSSYLFTWPLLFTLVALGVVFISKDRRSASWTRFAVTAAAIPGILIFAPMIYLVFTALALGMAGIMMALIVLSVGVLLLQLQTMAWPPRKSLLSGVMLMASLGFFVAGLVTSGFGTSHPQSDSLFYGLDADSGQAFWASGDRRPDEWTGQFITAKAGRATLAEVFPLGTRQYLKDQAPAAPLTAPHVELLNDSTNGNLRTLHMRVVSTRQAPYISVYVEPEVEVLAATVNGQELKGLNASNKGEKEWGLFYYGALPEGLDLTFDVNTTKPVKFRVVDRTWGLPETLISSVKPRPGYLMPLVMPNNGTTLVTKSFVF